MYACTSDQLDGCLLCWWSQYRYWYDKEVLCETVQSTIQCGRESMEKLNRNAFPYRSCIGFKLRAWAANNLRKHHEDWQKRCAFALLMVCPCCSVNKEPTTEVNCVAVAYTVLTCMTRVVAATLHSASLQVYTHSIVSQKGRDCKFGVWAFIKRSTMHG